MTFTRFYSLIDLQARMALRADASRYFLGYLWWILEPILFVAVFYLVFDVILESRRADFLLFLIVGKLSFVWFSGSVNQAANSIVASKGLIGQLNITKAIFPMAKVQEGVYKQIAVFALMFAIVIWSGAGVSFTWLWLVPIVMAQYFLICTCALIGAVLVSFIRDFSKLIGLAMIFLMFTSGIFWDVRQLADQNLADLLMVVNPLVFLVDAYRQVLMYNTAPDFWHLLGLLVVSVIAMLFTLSLIGRVEQSIAIKVLSE